MLIAVLKRASHVHQVRLGTLQSEHLAEAAVVRASERGHAYDAVARRQLPLAVLGPSRGGAGAAQRQAAVTPLDALARREEYPAWRVRSEREGAVPDDKLDAERGGRPVLVAGLRHGELNHHHSRQVKSFGRVTHAGAAASPARLARRTAHITPNLRRESWTEQKRKTYHLDPQK